MCVHTIPKASTYGEKDDWQILREFRVDVQKEINDSISEEDVETVILALNKMGCVLLSH